MIAQFGRGVLKRSALNIRDGEGVIREYLTRKHYRTILEIGTYKGVAAACMAQFCERVITIDLQHGRLEQLGVTWDRHAFWRELGIDNIDLHLVRDNAEKRSLIAGLQFDLAFVDGAHDASVRSDFEMVSHCGAVLFHDADDNGPGRSNCVFEFLKTLPQEKLEFIDIFALWTA